MSRIPAVVRDDLKPEDRQYFDEIAGARGVVRGPYATLLHSPKLAARVASTGAFLRSETQIPPDWREVVILTIARELDCQFEFSAHAPLARQLKVPEEAIRAIANRKSPQGLAKEPALLATYTLQLVRERRVKDATFREVKELLGVPGIVELTALIGHHLLVGHVMLAFELELLPGMKPELPG